MVGFEHIVMLILACISAVAASFFTIPLFIKIAFARNILDLPTSLKNHKLPTPYLGGLAVYSSFIIVLAIFFPVYWNLSLFLIGATLLLLIGLVDDLVPLSAFYKLLGQITASLCFLKGGFSLKQEFIESLSYSYAFVPYVLMFISFFWIVSVINALNLVDIMDGLATTVALGSLFGFLIFACLYNLYSVALLIVICIGSLVGFLYFNKAPARIYLGDAGSLFIGGILATIPFMIPWGTHTILGFLTPVIILAIPLVEMASLIVIRSYKGIPFYLGSPDHFAHYLLRKGWRKNSILLFVSITNALLISIALFFNMGKMPLSYALMLLAVIFAAWCATLYGKFTKTLSKKS